MLGMEWDNMKLPIDIVPNSNPPLFKWQQTFDPTGVRRVVDCDGTLPVSVETAVKELILLAKQQQQEIIGLRKQIELHADRIAAQSQLLSKSAETQIRKVK